MLGGDNIDLALAHHVEKKLGGSRLDAEQWSASDSPAGRPRKSSCATTPQERWPVTIAGRGSRIIGGSIQSELTRGRGRGDRPRRLLPACRPRRGAPAVRQARLAGIRPALRRRSRRSPSTSPTSSASIAPRPSSRKGTVPKTGPRGPTRSSSTAGALTPEVVRSRIVDVVTSWFEDDPGPLSSPRVLTNPSLDLAVARGAAYYGVVRRGGGHPDRRRHGTILLRGFETKSADKPWLCVVPRDAQEGEEIAIKGHDFDLLMGQPVLFPLASSSVRPDDRPGDLVRANPDSIRELPPLQSLMRVGRKAKAERCPGQPGRARHRGRHGRALVPVAHRRPPLAAPDPAPRPGRTARTPGGRSPAWKPTGSSSSNPRSTRRSRRSRPHSGGVTSAGEPHGPSRLVKRLEELLDAPRDQWPPSALRSLWEPLRDLADHRLKTPQHESRWFNLAGIRPASGPRLPARRDPDQGPLAPLPSRGPEHQGGAVLGGVVDPLEASGRGTRPPHHEEIFRRFPPS